VGRAGGAAAVPVPGLILVTGAGIGRRGAACPGARRGRCRGGGPALSAVDGDAFAHPEQAEAARRERLRRGPVVGDVDFDAAARQRSATSTRCERGLAVALAEQTPPATQLGASGQFLPSRRFLPGSQSAVSIATRVPPGFTWPTGTLTSRIPFS
jgi:hypothetical protein